VADEIDPVLLNCDKSFPAPFAYLLAGLLHTHGDALDNNVVMHGFLRSYSQRAEHVLECAEFASRLVAIIEARKSPLLTLPLLCNDIHWVLLIFYWPPHGQPLLPLVYVASSIQQAANLNLSQIRRDLFTYFGEALNHVLGSVLTAEDVRYVQFLQHGNMGCGFATFETQRRLTVRARKTSIATVVAELDAMTVRPTDRIMRADGWAVMALDPESGDVQTIVIHDAEKFTQLRRNLDSGRAGALPMPDQNATWDVIDAGVNMILETFCDRSVRYSIAVESVRRAELFLAWKRRKQLLSALESRFTD
jgi:hypothetical protein